MFYLLSKIIFFFIAPSNICWLLIAIGLLASSLTRFVRFGRLCAFAGLILLVVLGFAPIGQMLLQPLEDRFARPAGTTVADRLASAGPIDGVIVLGGFEDGRLSRRRGAIAVNQAAERMLEMTRLAKLTGQAPIIFSGGVGGILLRFETAGHSVRDYLRDIGIAEQRIVIESQSRNTWENALRTRELVKPKSGQRFLLVTSAFHMPRSVGVFRKAGWQVIAWPVDYRTADESDFNRAMPNLWTGLERTDTAVKEYIGLLAYWLTGRSSALFPAP